MPRMLAALVPPMAMPSQAAMRSWVNFSGAVSFHMAAARSRSVAGVPASLYAPWAMRSALPEATACERALAVMPSRAACPEVNTPSEAESSFIADM